MTRLRTALLATALAAVALPAFAAPVAPAAERTSSPSSLVQVRHDDDWNRNDHWRYEQQRRVYDERRRIEAERYRLARERQMLAEQRARYHYERRAAAEQYRYGNGYNNYAYNNYNGGNDLNVLLRAFIGN